MTNAYADGLLPGVPLVESPLFQTALAAAGLTDAEIEIARHLHEHGYAVLDFPDPDIDGRMDRIKAWVGQQFQLDLTNPEVIAGAGDLRLQDAWKVNEDVRSIAANADILKLLSRLYGRRAFPFQTLNFPVGTQQHPHSDSVHFSSLPERFMCGVWVAFEDVSAEAGPLEYYPASHQWPIATNAMLGRIGWGSAADSAQHPFEQFWRDMIREKSVEPATFLARKGQALIWAANLLHGGRPRIDRALTRWSQVTHYYFDDCIYYTPAFSDEHLNRLELRELTDIGTGETRASSYLGHPLPRPGSHKTRSMPQRLLNGARNLFRRARR